MRLIDGINTVLEALGEARTVDINSSNPSVGLARAAIDRTKRGVLATGWWFNTIYRSAKPVPLPGFINVPWDQLSIYGEDLHERWHDRQTTQGFHHRQYKKKYGERDGVLYDLVEQTKIFEHEVHLKIIINMDFEDLPEYTAMQVAYAAAAEVYLNDLGGDANYQQLMQKAQHYQEMNYREHLRNQQYSSSRNSAANRIRRGLRM
jgi:hypothetical protein